MLAGLTSMAFGEEVKRTGKIVSLHGNVKVKSLATGGDWVTAKAGMILNEGAVIKTKADSYAFLTLSGMGAATVQVEEHSQLLISKLVMDKKKKKQNTLLDLAIGEILVKIKKMKFEETTFQVKTPTTVLGARGTSFIVKVNKLK